MTLADRTMEKKNLDPRVPPGLEWQSPEFIHTEREGLESQG